MLFYIFLYIGITGCCIAFVWSVLDWYHDNKK